ALAPASQASAASRSVVRVEPRRWWWGWTHRDRDNRRRFRARRPMPGPVEGGDDDPQPMAHVASPEPVLRAPRAAHFHAGSAGGVTGLPCVSERRRRFDHRPRRAESVCPVTAAPAIFGAARLWGARALPAREVPAKTTRARRRTPLI